MFTLNTLVIVLKENNNYNLNLVHLVSFVVVRVKDWGYEPPMFKTLVPPCMPPQLMQFSNCFHDPFSQFFLMHHN